MKLAKAAVLIFLSLCLVMPAAPLYAQSAGASPPPAAPASGTITGTVVDQSGAVVSGAQIALAPPGQAAPLQTSSGATGEFAFADIAPGPFQLTVNSSGLATQTFSGTLHSGEFLIVPPVIMPVAPETVRVTVEPPPEEVAEIQVKQLETQRVFAVIPNFYVSYVADAVPLRPKQKFELAWKTSIDPFTFVVTGASAGLEQASDQFGGYGQGATGYAKRYGAAYADFVSGTFIGAAILPSLLKQDPRYFYKGTGTTRGRLLYAIANSVICKGDNKKWQPNYSAIGGDIASGGISNLYYPSADRGAALVFENAVIDIGATAAVDIFQEFIVRKLTPNLPSRSAAP
jgi:hypothetical protein